MHAVFVVVKKLHISVHTVYIIIFFPSLLSLLGIKMTVLIELL